MIHLSEPRACADKLSHLYVHDLYGIDVSPDLISTVTDAVLDEIVTWQQRLLDPVYPLVFFDAVRVKIRDEGMVRNKACPERSRGSEPRSSPELVK